MYPAYSAPPPYLPQSYSPYQQQAFPPPNQFSGFPSRFPNGGFHGYNNYAPPQPQAATVRPVPEAPKSDQPMVTIKRVMRPDCNEPTVTISVKKEDERMNEKEKVLFTLVNGQVMKTNHAPENLIPSAKPLPRDLARQILPDDMQVSTAYAKKNSTPYKIEFTDLY